MKRITSIKNAIKYFEDNSTSNTYEYKGKEYKKVIPPKTFHRLRITYSNGMTSIYEKWQWFDYAELIKKEIVNPRTNGDLVSISLYINI